MSTIYANPESRSDSSERAAAPPRGIAGLVNRWYSRTARKGAVALADQVIVSGVNFLTTVLVGRCCGPAELGFYSLGFTLVVFVHCCHHALVVAPYTIYVHRLPKEKRAGYSGDVLIHCGMLGLFAAIVLAVVARAPLLGWGPRSMMGLGEILAVTIPLYLLREFGRRFAFAQLQMTTALIFDAATAALQVTLLFSLVATKQLSAIGAFAVAGVSYAAIGITWLFAARKQFQVRWAGLRKAWHGNWSFSRWVLAEQIANALNSYLSHWLLAALVGIATTGIFAACATLLGAFNPILLAFNNVILPRIAMAQSHDSHDELRQVLWKTTIVVGSLTSLFAGTLLLFGPHIIRMLYGTAYAGQEGVVAVLAIDMLVNSLATAPGYGLWVLQGARNLFFIRLLRIGVAIAITIALAGRLGPLGAAYGLLAGTIIGSATTYFLYRAVAAAHEATKSISPSNLTAEATL